MTQQDIEQKARDIDRSFVEITQRLSGLGYYDPETTVRIELGKIRCYVDSLRQQLADKDAEIERLRTARGLLPICEVDQKLFAADVTCRQQAEMIIILQSEIAAKAAEIERLNQSPDGLPFATLKEMYTLSLLAFRRCAYDMRHLADELYTVQNGGVPHNDYKWWYERACYWIGISTPDGNKQYRSELHQDINEKASLIEKQELKIEQLQSRVKELEGMLEFLYHKCKIVFFPGNNEYPIEHTLLANKDNWQAILDFNNHPGETT